MRDNIYYWKCDSPVPQDEKKNYNDKYSSADISGLINDICKDNLGESPLSVTSTGSAGNHYAYIIEYSDKKIFFRADDGKADDDYKYAEAAAMQAAGKAGIPVPELYVFDASLEKYPIRYQLLELVTDKCLNVYHQEGTLQVETISRQLGTMIGRLHSIAARGFGFFNTDILKEGGEVEGIDKTSLDYFNKCLEVHKNFLLDNEFLQNDEIKRIEKIFVKYEKMLTIEQGCLVHKDLAFWNILGTKEKVTALIDWDDVIVGDPIDDIGILMCFYDSDIMKPLLEGYKEVKQLPDDFEIRSRLYFLRNMLWKAMIRLYMGYFEIKDDFYILNNDNKESFREYTYKRLVSGIEELEKG